MPPRIHRWTLLSFVLAFLKPRLGGGAAVAALATRIAHGTRRGKIYFNDLILRRVFGGVGADITARSARTELSRMLLEGPPVGVYMKEIQVARPCVCAAFVYIWVVSDRGMGSMADEFVFLQEDAQQLIDTAAYPAEQQAALGVHDAADAFQIDAFELNAIANFREATQAKDM